MQNALDLVPTLDNCQVKLDTKIRRITVCAVLKSKAFSGNETKEFPSECNDSTSRTAKEDTDSNNSAMPQDRSCIILSSRVTQFNKPNAKHYHSYPVNGYRWGVPIIGLSHQQ